MLFIATIAQCVNHILAELLNHLELLYVEKELFKLELKTRWNQPDLFD